MSRLGSMRIAMKSDARGLSDFWIGGPQLPEIRMAHVLDAIDSHHAGRLRCVEEGEFLDLSERHFRRLRDAYEERGEEGVIDRQRGRVSGPLAGKTEIAWAMDMFRTRYFDFRIKHFHEQIHDHDKPMACGKPFRRSYAWPAISASPLLMRLCCRQIAKWRSPRRSPALQASRCVYPQLVPAFRPR